MKDLHHQVLDFAFYFLKKKKHFSKRIRYYGIIYTPGVS